MATPKPLLPISLPIRGSPSPGVIAACEKLYVELRDLATLHATAPSEIDEPSYAFTSKARAMHSETVPLRRVTEPLRVGSFATPWFSVQEHRGARENLKLGPENLEGAILVSVDPDGPGPGCVVAVLQV